MLLIVPQGCTKSCLRLRRKREGPWRAREGPFRAERRPFRATFGPQGPFGPGGGGLHIPAPKWTSGEVTCGGSLAVFWSQLSLGPFRARRRRSVGQGNVRVPSAIADGARGLGLQKPFFRFPSEKLSLRWGTLVR